MFKIDSLKDAIATSDKSVLKMSGYKAGALTDLFGTPSEAPLSELFTADKSKQPAEEEEDFSEYLKELQDEEDSAEAVEEPNKNANDEDEENDEAPTTFTHPSRRFQVRHEEDNREQKERDTDQEKRTIFVGNLASDVTQKQIKKAFKPFGDIETIRLRGAARPDLTTTKKQAIIQRKFHENRNNLIAYVRFKEESSAKASLKMNGQKLGERTLRVDLALSSTTEHDQSKAIFVGNLRFAIEEDEIRQHFSKCGEISAVRIIRDSKTGIGKGFGYVNFATRKSVKTALELMDGTQLSGRAVRVTKSVDRPKKTVSVEVKRPKGGILPVKQSKTAAVKTVKKVKKKTLRGGDFQGKKFNEEDVKSKKSRKKPSQGERKRKMIAQKLT